MAAQSHHLERRRIITTGKTHDLKLFLGKNDELHQLINVLGLSITGSTTITNESFLDREFEDASIHLVSQAVGFSTVYDTVAFDAVVDALLGERGSSDSEDIMFACVADKKPKSWQLIPVSFPRPSENAPSADAITRPWSLNQRARGWFGLLVDEFITGSAGTPAKMGMSQNGDGSGEAESDLVQVIILTEKDPATSAIVFADGSENHDVTDALGIQVFDNDSAAGEMTITTTGGSASGILLQGRKEHLPRG